MHRTQVLLGEDQYRRLRRESAVTGKSIAALIREAVDAHFDDFSREELTRALVKSFGAWRDRDVDGAEYVETLREGLGERLRELGWD